MLGAAGDASVEVVVAEIPRLARVDGLSAAPTHRTAARDNRGYLRPFLPVGPVVAALGGGALAAVAAAARIAR
jgi:hypothetical protein